MEFWSAAASLPAYSMFVLFVALVIAFGFEFINGFHDTANAVTTVIYTNSLPPTPAVIYSGFLNFLGVLLGGTAVAYSIVNLLPVDLLVEVGTSSAGLVMVLSLLLAAVAWNLGTWYVALPVSSSHTLIGSILGVGLANSLLRGDGLAGVNWGKVGEVFLALLLSPVVGFAVAALLLLGMLWLLPNPALYQPLVDIKKPPPFWIRATLILSCGSVSYAHGSNDGQKGMGLLLLVLVGFLPFAYALDTNNPDRAEEVYVAAGDVLRRLDESGHADEATRADLAAIRDELAGKHSFNELAREKRWDVRQAIFRVERAVAAYPAEVRQPLAADVKVLRGAIEFVPFWVVVGTALALGVGTTVGYRRIVITVAEKIGKTHLSYGQGMMAEVTAAATILVATYGKMPVSTTHVLSSGVAGTMWATGSGVQAATTKKILLAWVLTLPASMAMSGGLYCLGRLLIG